MHRAFALFTAGVAGLAVATGGAAQDVRIVDAGPRGAARPLAEALAGRHELRVTSDTLVDLPRGTSVDQSIIIVGARRVTVASRVQGSVIVIGGDLFLHPGVELTGDAVAYGGGVYLTSLGTWRRAIDHRNFTFELGGSDGAYTLRYRPISVLQVERVELPGVSGFRIPAYDRTNGVSLAWGPRFNAPDGRYSVDMIGTYRSDLGAVDPRIETTARMTRLSTISLSAERTTLTNEEWIRGTLLASLGSLLGYDVRNYRRADRGELTYRREIELSSAVFTPMIGGQAERAWSVGPERGATGNPWSIVNQTDTIDGMRRPNPPVVRGRMTSAVTGGSVDGTFQDLALSASALIEVPVETPDDSRFVQGTIDGRLDFPTFRNHTFRFDFHAMVTAGDVAPPQRFSYIGGSGTLPTVDLLTMGGDQVLFFESRYTVPIERIVLPYFLGSPMVSLRHMIGSAGVDRLPGFVNNVGVRVAVSFLKVDFTIDPETRDTDWSVGLSMSR